MKENTPSSQPHSEEKPKIRISISSSEEKGYDYPYHSYTIASANNQTVSLEDKALFPQSGETSDRIIIVKLKSDFSLRIAAFIKYSNIPEMTFKGVVLYVYDTSAKQSEKILLPFPEIKVGSKALNLAKMFFFSIVKTESFGFICIVILCCYVFIVQIKVGANGVSYELAYKEKKQGKLLYLGYQMNEFDVTFHVLSKPSNLFINFKCVFGVLSDRINVYPSDEAIKDFGFQSERFTVTSSKWILITEKHCKKDVLLNKEQLKAYELKCDCDLSVNVFHLIFNENELHLLTDSRSGDTVSILQSRLVLNSTGEGYDCIPEEIYRIKCENSDKHGFNVINDQCFYVSYQANFVLFYLNMKTKRFESVHCFNFGSFISLSQTHELNTFSSENRTHVVLNVYKDMNVVMFDFALKENTEAPMSKDTESLSSSYNKGSAASIHHLRKDKAKLLIASTEVKKEENKRSKLEEFLKSFTAGDKTSKPTDTDKAQAVNEDPSSIKSEKKVELSTVGKPFYPLSMLKQQQSMPNLLDPVSINPYVGPNQFKTIPISNIKLVEVKKVAQEEKGKGNSKAQYQKLIEDKVDSVIGKKIVSISDNIFDKYNALFSSLEKQTKEMEEKENSNEDVIGNLLSKTVHKEKKREVNEQKPVRFSIEKMDEFSKEAVNYHPLKSTIENKTGNSKPGFPCADSLGLGLKNNKPQYQVGVDKGKESLFPSTIKVQSKEPAVNPSVNTPIIPPVNQKCPTQPSLNNSSVNQQPSQFPSQNQMQLNHTLIMCYHTLNTYNLYNNIITNFMNSQIIQALYPQPSLQYGIQPQMLPMQCLSKPQPLSQPQPMFQPFPQQQPPFFPQQCFPFNMLQQMQQFQQQSIFPPTPHRDESAQLLIQQLNPIHYPSSKPTPLEAENRLPSLFRNSPLPLFTEKLTTNYTPSSTSNSLENDTSLRKLPKKNDIEIEEDNDGFIEIKGKKKGNNANITTTANKKANNRSNNQRKKK